MVSRFYIFSHLGRTVQLVARCLADPRTGWPARLGFLGVLGLLLGGLLVPELGVDGLLAFVPCLGQCLDLLGLPTEGVADWGTLVLVLPALLRLLPPEVLAEHAAALGLTPAP